MKRVVVIGGSGTVGRALCAELVAGGARVGATHHRGRCPEGVIARALDLTDAEAIAPCIDALVDELGGIDALVHCAVVGGFDALEDVTVESWDRLMAVNIRSAFFAARQAAARMTAGGNIVLLGSIDGIKPVPSPVPYGVSKAALVGLALTLTKALGQRNIRVNVVAPGILEAGISKDVPDDLRQEYLRHSGLRRLGRIDEVTGIIAWLALENSYVTGQTVNVDGGALTMVGVLALGAYVVHGGNHVLRGTPYDLLWACNVAPLLLAAGAFLQSARLCGVALLWLTFGTPMWLADVATGGGVIPTTFLTHIGCPVLGVLAVRQLGMPAWSWGIASVGILTLMLACRLVSPPEMNINLSHAVWAGWEKQFPRYDVYFGIVYGAATATFFLAEKLWTRLL